mmetsp:Transcript_41593/g.109801  ORF Transcript_41593/g.109801 Transcript_41593/m.109801 type:complete len:314 (-) Transcript_41593:14-955(-)
MASAGSIKLSDLVTQAAEGNDPPALGAIASDADAHYVDEADDDVGPCGCRCSLFRRPKPRPAQSGKKTASQIKTTSVVPSPGKQATMEDAPAAQRDPFNARGTTGSSRDPRPSPRIPDKAQAVDEKHGQLGPQVGANIGRKTLVLDLDETLVHSSFRHVDRADIVITVELEGELHKVYVRKRPGVDKFLKAVAESFEVVIYTASMAKYANPLMDVLDPEGLCTSRLFREACTRHGGGGYIKDLSKLGRSLKNVIIIDNSPICYAMQPDNAIPIKTWREDPTDQELLELVPILRALVGVEDIPAVLRQVVWSME